MALNENRDAKQPQTDTNRLQRDTEQPQRDTNPLQKSHFVCTYYVSFQCECLAPI